MSIETGNFLLYSMMVGIIIIAFVFGYTDELAKAKRKENSHPKRKFKINKEELFKDFE